MDYHYFLNDLIAYMQREGVLPSDETVYGELADILGLYIDEAIELFS